MSRYNIDEVETDEGDQISDSGGRQFAKRNADQPKRSPIHRKNKMRQEEGMKPKNLNYFKSFLTQWLDELLGRSGNTVVGLIDSEEHLSDPLDRAVLDTERSFTLRIRGRESVLIKKIRASLEDIEDGVYGICDDCGRYISIARLKARPVARRCIKCKTREEEQERLTGVG